MPQEEVRPRNLQFLVIDSIVVAKISRIVHEHFRKFVNYNTEIQRTIFADLQPNNNATSVLSANLLKF